MPSKPKHRRKQITTDTNEPEPLKITCKMMTTVRGTRKRLFPALSLIMVMNALQVLVISMLILGTMADADLLVDDNFSFPSPLGNEPHEPREDEILSRHPTASEIDDNFDFETTERIPFKKQLKNLSDSSYANLSFEELWELDVDENPLRDPLSIAIPMTVIYSLILLSGLVGNVSTCVVIARTSYMHTATNYYLFSLAMSDLLLLISGLPQEIYHIWIKYPYIFGEAFCVIRGLAAETSANATVLTITAFTVERFVAIVYPLKSHKLSQLSRVVRMIGIIWVVAFCLALPQAAQFGLQDHMSSFNPNVLLIQGAWCTLVREIFPYAFQISICVFFAIPMTIISVLYILIGLKLRRSRKGPLKPEPRPHARSQSHVVRMLVAVVICFFICWFPFHAQRLMALYGSSHNVSSAFFLTVYQGLTHVSGILYYLSTCVNPILYHIMSNKFRQAFKDTLGHLCGKPTSRGHHSRTYSAMSYSHRSSRMMHYTSHRNNTNANAISLLNKNSQKGRTLVGMIGKPVMEKYPVDIDISGIGLGMNITLEEQHGGRCHRSSSNPTLNNLNGNGNSNSTNGKIINMENGTFPCQCSSSSNNGENVNAIPSKMMMMGLPKTATTIMSKSSFVTRSHCTACGGYTSSRDANSNGNGSGRGVTFGFLGKARNKHVNNLYHKNNVEEYCCNSSNDTSMTPLNSSPASDRGEDIPMTDIHNGSSGNRHQIQNQQSSPLIKRIERDSSESTKKSKGKPSLRAFLSRKKDNKNGSSLLMSSSGFGHHHPQRLPSDPSLPSTYAVTMLDSKGKSKTLLHQRERTGSSGNVLGGGALVKNTCRAASYTSMDSAKSNNTNTISNSSLQDMEEGEYTSEELAGYMAELNLNLESPKTMNFQI